MLETAEKLMYTNKINVSANIWFHIFLQTMLKSGNENVAEQEKQYGIADLFGGD